MSALKELTCLVLAVALTWIILHRPAPAHGGGAPPAGSKAEGASTVVSLRPVNETAVEVASATPEPLVTPPSDEPQEPAEALAPREIGSRSGSVDASPGTLGAMDELHVPESGPEALDPVDEIVDPAEDADPDAHEPAEESASGSGPSPTAQPARASARELAEDPELVTAAKEELSGAAEASLGFATVLVSSPEDQLDIARAFGEEIVLVPKSALGAESLPDVQSFRLMAGATGTPRVEVISGRPNLESARQYRDLFAYEFRRLPPALREFRSRLPRRDEVFLFAALIPASEWAVVIGRRREALVALGIELESVERFVLRYVRVTGGSFDFVVDAIHLAGGQTILPPKGLR